GVAALYLQRDEPLLELALDAAEAGPRIDAAVPHVLAEEEIARKLLGDRARALALACEHVASDRDQNAVCTQSEVPLETGIFRRDDRVPERRPNLIVANDDTPLRGEVADL